LYAFIEQKNETEANGTILDAEQLEEEGMIYLDLFIIAIIQQIERHKDYLSDPTEEKANEITMHYHYMKAAETDLDENSKDALLRFKSMVRYEECINVRVDLKAKETNASKADKPGEDTNKSQNENLMMLQEEDLQEINETETQEQMEDDISFYENDITERIIARFEPTSSSDDIPEGIESTDDNNTVTNDGRNDNLELGELNDKPYQVIAWFYENDIEEQIVETYEQTSSSNDALEGTDSAEDYNTDTDDGRNDNLELGELNDKLYQTIARLRLRNQNLQEKNEHLKQKVNGFNVTNEIDEEANEVEQEHKQQRKMNSLNIA
jgi:hypothetical protein